MGGFLLNICRTNYCNILTLIFGNFWWHLEISGIWKLEIWKSGSSLELAGFDQFQHIGYFSHSVLVAELDFQLRFSKFQSAWNFSRNFLESGNSLEFAVLGPFQHMGHLFHLILAAEIDFSLRISNFPFFWSVSRIFLKIWKFYGICQFWPISTYWVGLC